jgi:glycosyltransferase involved in cell wall biosynthesis
MLEKKFTVIMPLYNHDLYVGEAIQSVLNQKYENFELVICNDGSTDNSLEVAKSFQDERIKIIDKPNGGCVSALNACILQSTGDYICWLSSDDYFGVDKLNYHLFAHSSLGARISIAPSAEFRGGAFKNINYNIEGGIARMLPFLGRNPINGLAICAHRSMYIECGLFDSRYKFSHDYERWLSFLKYEEPVYVDGEPQSFTRLGTSFVNDSNPFFNGDLDNFRVIARRLHEGIEYFIPEGYKGNDDALKYILKLFLSMSDPGANYFFRFGFSDYYIKSLCRFIVKFNMQGVLEDIKKSDFCSEKFGVSTMIAKCQYNISINDLKVNPFDFITHLKFLASSDILSYENRKCVEYYIKNSLP